MSDVQTVKKSIQRQVIQSSNQNFTGTVEISPLTTVTDGINVPSVSICQL
ncbi:hypothetical protein [Acinetobacter nectaris]|nr:hypothetical protein [Acinetobacter nectaris]